MKNLQGGVSGLSMQGFHASYVNYVLALIPFFAISTRTPGLQRNGHRVDVARCASELDRFLWDAIDFVPRAIDYEHAVTVQQSYTWFSNCGTDR